MHKSERLVGETCAATGLLGMSCGAAHAGAALVQVPELSHHIVLTQTSDSYFACAHSGDYRDWAFFEASKIQKIRYTRDF
jgi:hypothetical protein